MKVNYQLTENIKRGIDDMHSISGKVAWLSALPPYYHEQLRRNHEPSA